MGRAARQEFRAGPFRKIFLSSLNTRQLENYPWPRRTEIDYQVTVDVLRFETSADGQSQLIARWVIKDGRTGKDLAASETNASAPVGQGETGPSAALSSDLASLSRDIAARITALNQNPPRTANSIDRSSLDHHSVIAGTSKQKYSLSN